MGMKDLQTRYGDDANAIDDVRANPSTMALLSIDYPHHKIHQRNAFASSYTIATAATDDHRTGLGFTTPAGAKSAHMIIQATCTHPAEVFLLEAPTIDADPGTNKVSLNRNRVGTPAVSVLGSLETVPTAGEVTTLTEAQIAAATFSGGTLLDYMLLAGGGGPFALGGSGRGAQEWILEAATKYLIYIQNIGANANTHLINLDWYEHTPIH